jgi:hypothetical protein
MPEHAKPGTSISFDPTSRPSLPSPEAIQSHAVAITQRWLDSLGRAPTAEGIVVYAENYNA